jgi:hypothetical protein
LKKHADRGIGGSGADELSQPDSNQIQMAVQ